MDCDLERLSLGDSRREGKSVVCLKEPSFHSNGPFGPKLPHKGSDQQQHFAGGSTDMCRFGRARWPLVFSNSVLFRVWTQNKICLTCMCDVYSIAG